MFIISDRVKQNSITSGYGDIVFENAFPGFQTFFNGIGDGNTTYYTVENNTNFEIGIGTYHSDNNSLSRDTILYSSNNNQKINLNGLSIIFCTYPANRAVIVNTDGMIESQNINYSGIILNEANLVYDSNASQLKLNNAIISFSGHLHNIEDINGLQTVLDSKQPSGTYSIPSHTHTSSDITNFDSSVSGLLPITNIIAGSGLSIIKNNSDFTVSISGNYSTVGHTHTSSNITDFNSSVSGLLLSYAQLISPNFSGIPTVPTAISGSDNTQIANTQFVRTEIANLVNSAPSTLDTLNELAIALNNDNNFATTITNNLATKASLSGSIFTGSISGPSANFTSLLQNGIVVSTSGHIHPTSDISNFDIAVSSLLPVKQIVAGSNISLINNSGTYSIGVSGQLGLTSEEVDDRIGELLSSGSYIHLNYDDLNNKLIISATGLQPSGNYSIVGHSHPSSDINDFTTNVSGIIDSVISTSISGGVGIDIAYYSTSNTLLISTSGLSLLGHQHTSSEITDFTSSVRSNRLNDMTVPSGNVSFNNYRLTNLASAVSGTDAINKSYIDNLYASTSGLGLASFNSSNFSVVSGVVSVKSSGIDNSKLLYNYIVLGSSTINLGSTALSVGGLRLDGGTP
jgi:hypothetical protein